MKYRDRGAIGALLDEYERAVEELIKLLDDINEEELVTIADQETVSSCCKSIQTILSHVVNAGYWYVRGIRVSLGEAYDFQKTPLLDNIIS